MSSITEAFLGSQSTSMTDGEPTGMGHDEQGHAPIEEARLARRQAEEAVQRVQQRIERLVSLSKGDDNGQERTPTRYPQI